MASKGAKAPELLSLEELAQRLCLRSELLVGDLYDISLRRLQTEESRESRLDGKAQGLLVTAGLSNTVAFTFGGFLLQHAGSLAPRWIIWPVVVLFSACLVFGLLASIWAVRALYVSDGYRAISESDILNAAELEAADPDDDKDAKAGSTRYRRFLVHNFLQIYRAHFAVHDRKATLIKRGQTFFMVFLLGLILIGVAMTVSAVEGSSSSPVSAVEESPVIAVGESPKPAAPAPSSQPASTPRPAPTSIPSGGTPVRRNDPPVPVSKRGGP